MVCLSEPILSVSIQTGLVPTISSPELLKILIAWSSLANLSILNTDSFLLSSNSSSITGTTIKCDGGTLSGAGWFPYGGFPNKEKNININEKWAYKK